MRLICRCVVLLVTSVALALQGCGGGGGGGGGGAGEIAPAGNGASTEGAGAPETQSAQIAFTGEIDEWEPGDMVTIEVQVTDSANRPIPDLVIDWDITDESVATIEPLQEPTDAQGIARVRLTVLAVGETRLSATVTGTEITGSATLSAVPPAVDMANGGAQEASTQRKNILYFSGAETGAIDIGGMGEDSWREELHQNNRSLAVVDDIVRSGNHAFMLRYDIAWQKRTGDAWRNELKRPGGIQLQEGKEYWIGWSHYMPDDRDHRDMVNTNATNVKMAQWHYVDISGTSGIDFRQGRYYMDFGTLGGTTFGPVQLGVWNDWVMHVKLGNAGWVRVWLNAGSDKDTPVYSKGWPQGVNTSNSPLNIKIGQYYGDAVIDRLSPDASIRYYYDEYRIGGKNASFADVRPGDF